MYAESDKVSKEAIVLANTCVAIISELLVVYKYDPPILPKDCCPRVHKNAAHILILQCLEKKSAVVIGLWRLSNELDAAITMYEDMMTRQRQCHPSSKASPLPRTADKVRLEMIRRVY